MRRAAGLRPGPGEDPHRRERPGARGARGRARNRRLEVRADDPAVGRRRGQPRRVGHRHRLDDEGGAPQGGLPADRVEPERDLQLGHRHHRAADERRAAVRGRLAPVVRPDRQGRRVRRDGAVGLQERLGQARRQHAAPDARADAGHPRRLRGPGLAGPRPSRVRLRPRRPRRRLAAGTDRLAGAAAQPAAPGVRSREARRGARQDVLAADGQQQPRPRPRDQEGRAVATR